MNLADSDTWKPLAAIHSFAASSSTQLRTTNPVDLGRHSARDEAACIHYEHIHTHIIRSLHSTYILVWMHCTVHMMVSTHSDYGCICSNHHIQIGAPKLLLSHRLSNSSAPSSSSGPKKVYVFPDPMPHNSS